MTIRTLILTLLSLFALALPATANPGMSAAEFEAYTKGKTLIYSVNGQDYGIERYMEGRRVTWSFLDGECTDGHWYEENGQICFAYEGWEAPQCWYFRTGPQGLSAEFADENGRTAFYRAEDRGEDMVCLGPKTGV